MDERLVSVKRVLENEEFVQRLAMQEEPEEVQKMFEKEGVIISLDEVRQMGKMLASSEHVELNENDLEAVSGGSIALATAIVNAVAFVISVGGAHYKKYGKW